MHQFTYTHTYECIDTAAGDHIIDVTTCDKCVDGSPFTSKVYDTDQIIVGTVPTQTILNQPVCFGSQFLMLSSSVL